MSTTDRMLAKELNRAVSDIAGEVVQKERDLDEIAAAAVIKIIDQQEQRIGRSVSAERLPWLAQAVRQLTEAHVKERLAQIAKAIARRKLKVDDQERFEARTIHENKDHLSAEVAELYLRAAGNVEARKQAAADARTGVARGMK